MIKRKLEAVANWFFVAMLWLAAVLIAGYLMIGLTAVALLRGPLKVLSARVNKGGKK